MKGESRTNDRQIKPVLRWAGGKSKLLSKLISYIPRDFNAQVDCYREPFLGAASLYLALLPKRAYLSDANASLICFYLHLRSRACEISEEVERLKAINSERNYYKIREEYNGSRCSYRQAARFLYLNKACFNGIFRVNTKGEFNVPYGWKEPPAIPSQECLVRVARALQDANIFKADYLHALASATKGDFIYLDPPYPPLNKTAYFTHYTMDRFNDSDQEALASEVRRLDSIGCKLLISNADTRLIRELYQGFTIRRLPVTRYLTCKSERRRVNEVIIANYEV